MGLTERHWFENEDVPENYEWALEDAVYNSRTNKKHDDIIRCKDCKHGCGSGYGMYCQFIECKKTGAFHKEDWFCADGERR